LVMIESTIPPLTCRNFITPLLERSGLKVGQDIYLAYCPERILPGNVFYEIVHNDRIIGSTSKKAQKLAHLLYSSFVTGKMYFTDDVTAELCKLMENAYRDVNIALANEFAQVAQGLGIDHIKAIELANKHPRVNILKPGIGVGGHCIPVDPWFIREIDPKNSQLITTARKVNDAMPARIAKKIKKKVAGIPNPKIIALGASYKANTQDLRESPAIEIVKLLRKDGYNVSHYDPLIDIYQYPKDLPSLCAHADLLVILVPHSVILTELASKSQQIKQSMRHAYIFQL